MMKISIIVPVYNVETYLEKCVESLISQSYENLEIILVDDGATDRSGEICDQLAETDTRITVIHKENGGLSSARNTGLLAASGDYIGFVDSDDHISSQMYEKLMRVVKETGADIAVCNFVRVTEEGRLVGNEPEENSAVQVFERRTIQRELNTSGNNRELFVVAWNKIYRRDLFHEVRFPEGKLHEDEATTYKLLYYAERVAYTAANEYYYLVREGSITNKFTLNRFDIFDAYLARLEFYAQQNEQMLCETLVFQYMHMLAQYISWFQSYGNEARTAIHQYKDKLVMFVRKSSLNLTGRRYMEFQLFKHLKAYHFIWCKAKKIRQIK